jgi:protein SCO1/2
MTRARARRCWPSRLAIAVALLVVAGAAAAPDVAVRGAPKALVAFALEDAAGRPFSNAELKGRWSLMMLGFTHCPDVCPFTLDNLALVREQMSTRMAPERLPRVVFLAVDPERDRPVLAEYVKHFGDDVVGVTGAEREIKALVDSLEGYARIVRRSSADMDYQVQHSAAVSLIDPQGRIRATLKPPMDPSETAEFLTEFMRRAAVAGP